MPNILQRGDVRYKYKVVDDVGPTFDVDEYPID